MQRFNASISAPEMQTYLASVLGEKKSSFVNNVVALVSNNTMLQACAPMSTVYACLKATALDLPLDPNLGFAYVIPYGQKNGPTLAQFQLGYRGFIQLALRSKQFAALNVTEIREGELKGRDIISGEIQIEAVDDRESKPVIGYVAYFRLLTGFEKKLYMTRGEVDAHALRYSKTYGSAYESTRKSSKWTTDFDAMAKKTVLKLLLSRWAPLSVEMQAAITSDQKVYSNDGTGSYADNPDDQIQMETVEDKKAQMRENQTQGSTLNLP